MENRRERVKISRVERWTMRVGIPVAVVAGAGALAFASVSHSFANGETLQATDLNANFAGLDQRIQALEARALPIQVVVQAVPAADILDTGNYSVYVACPMNSRPIGGGCSLFQTNLSGNWEYNSQARATGCYGALASYSPSPTSRMCLRTGNENIGDLINDGNGSDLTINSLGWKCSMGVPPANTSMKAYVSCLKTQ
jgi:hypothetical protein